MAESPRFGCRGARATQLKPRFLHYRERMSNEARVKVVSIPLFLFSFEVGTAVERAIREVSSPHQSCLPCSALRAKMSSATTHNLTNNILTARPSKNSNSQGTKDASCTTPSWIRFQSDGRISDDMVKEDDLTTPPRAQS